MPRGNWSFLHEWVIYDYLMVRFAERTLRLNRRVKSNVLLRKEGWAKVTHLRPIQDSTFPDIKEVAFSNSTISRPAEVKFTTSLFDYHRSLRHANEYQSFVANNGFILVLSHDYLPTGLTNPTDVYEVELADFVSFCRENFSRLLNRQIRAHAETKVWVMYQGPNFNEASVNAQAGRESYIWCPTENLTGFDLSVGDRILFVKTSGASTQTAQKQYLGNQPYTNWRLTELWIGQVSSAIYSRAEYCHIKGIPVSQQLWKNDPIKNSQWRWNRVFEFSPLRCIQKQIDMQNLGANPLTKGFVDAVVQAFCFGKSREISMSEYLALLEQIA